MKKFYIISAVLIAVVGLVAFFSGARYAIREAKPVKIVKLAKFDEVKWCPFWRKYCYVAKR